MPGVVLGIWCLIPSTALWRKLVRNKFKKGIRLADSYYNLKGRKCFKGNRHMRASAAYPRRFGRKAGSRDLVLFVFPRSPSWTLWPFVRRCPSFMPSVVLSGCGGLRAVEPEFHGWTTGSVHHRPHPWPLDGCTVTWPNLYICATIGDPRRCNMW